MNLLPCETNSLVYDFGSNSIQLGFAGDAQPLYSIPSSSCQRPKDGDIYIEFGDSWLQKKYEGIEIKQIISDNGTLADKNLLASFFDWTYQSCLSVDPVEHPILVTQPSHLALQTSFYDQWRKDICESAFDFAGHPSLCFEHDSVLACFSRAASTAIVVDFGWSCIRVVPILDGQPILKSLSLSKTGGCQLCSLLLGCLKKNTLSNPANRMVPIGAQIPQLSNNYRPNIFFDDNNLITSVNIDNENIPTPTQQQYCTKFLLQDMIKSCLSFPSQMQQKEEPGQYIYYMPNREPIDLKDEVQYLSHVLTDQLKPQEMIQSGIKSVPECIYASINNNNTPADVRRQLWKNIVTSGGLSMLQGFCAKLELLASAIKPQNYTAKVIPPKNPLTGGSNTVWVGGSILASMDNFTEFCITKEEWEENGESILNTKFK
ncbi:hypothetical protein M9Y10_045098 [Tritrichomonas musculus]|uniref:Actin family protein n=1 Tax=Tritrichomonas musculus TaxID=1915356 RepID=A0ABR2JVL0_9EUKA